MGCACVLGLVVVSSVGLAGVARAGITASASASTTGDDWAIQHSVSPSGASSPTLMGVSCPSSEECVAVGDYSNGTTTRMLAEGWNGKKWALQTPSGPSGAAYDFLKTVKCPSTSDCVAVGAYSKSDTTEFPLVEH